MGVDDPKACPFSSLVTMPNSLVLGQTWVQKFASRGSAPRVEGVSSVEVSWRLVWSPCITRSLQVKRGYVGHEQCTHGRRSWELRGPADPLKICRRGQGMFWPPKMSHSFIQNCCCIILQISHHQEWKMCVKNGR